MAAYVMTYEIAHAAGWDAGNRSAKRAGRKEWNADDYAAAAAVVNMLLIHLHPAHIDPAK